MTDIIHETGQNWTSSLEEQWEDVISKSGNLPGLGFYKLIGLGDFLSDTNDNITIRATIDGIAINGGSFPVKIAGDYVQFNIRWKAQYVDGEHILKIQVRPEIGQTITMEQGIIQVIKE